jgi:hypothetical protein
MQSSAAASIHPPDTLRVGPQQYLHSNALSVNAATQRLSDQTHDKHVSGTSCRGGMDRSAASHIGYTDRSGFNKTLRHNSITALDCSSV